MSQRSAMRNSCLAALAAGLLAGCSGSDSGAKPKASAAKAEGEPVRKFQPVALGTAKTGPGAEESPEESMANVRAALDPLQIMVGKWRGTTFKKMNGFNSVEELQWIWDFKTDKAQPALVFKSDKDPYFREARLTYLAKPAKYQITVKTNEGVEKVLQGKFEKEPSEETGDDGKPQRTYKLVMAQITPKDDPEQWQVVLNQQENNRYNLEIDRKRGGATFARLDTIGAQRLGTSFAANDEDYGEKKCVISGGLGTIQVSYKGENPKYKGKQYWVCCTGCESAFEEDADRWLAKLPDDFGMVPQK